MNEIYSNCIGYARFKSKIDRVERFVPLPSVREALKDYSVVFIVDEADTIAFVRGIKLADEFSKLQFTIEHMAAIEDNNGNCTHRVEEGGEIEPTTINLLLRQFISECNTVYPILLKARNA